MDLKYYLFKNNIKGVDFAKKIGITATYLCMLKARKVKPSKFLALAIEIETGGEVTREDLL